METMTEPMTAEPQAPICATQKCKRPLTRLGPPQNCWRCLVCNPIVKTAPTLKKKDKYIDVTLTEKAVAELIVGQYLESTEKGGVLKSSELTKIINDQIREIVQDELANWHIQKPPVTRDEIAETIAPSSTVEPTWRQRAKELGVPLHKEPAGSGMRKKEDVLADMERLGEPPIEETDAQIPEELRTEEQG